MAEYLSHDWLAAAAERFATVRLDPPAPAPGLVICVVIDGDVTDGDDATPAARFDLLVEGDAIQLAVGGSEPPDLPVVRLRTGAAVARRIAVGEISAQRAFMAGDLQLGGDVTQLLTHRELLASVGDVLGDLRPPR